MVYEWDVLGHPHINTYHWKKYMKVELSITSSAPTSTAQMLTLENLAGLLDTG